MVHPDSCLYEFTPVWGGKECRRMVRFRPGRKLKYLSAIQKISSAQIVRLLIAFSSISTCGMAGPSTILAHLPNTGIEVVKLDASGNIFIAGFKGSADTPDSYDAFVAKLNSDGSKVLYSTTFAGSKYEDIFALEIDSTGAAYIFGQTRSQDFPVTAGAVQSTLGGAYQAFVAKVDAQGKVVYATLLGGNSVTSANPGGLVVNAAGEAFVSGQTINGNFPAISGAPFTSVAINANFILKLDAGGGKILAAIRGVGGRIASDDQASIYIAGSQYGEPAIPVTPGAVQSTHQSQACAGTAQLALSCSYQYVTKVDPTLSQILYSTFITGSWGAAPSAILVDAQHNVLVAGTTNSPDYPTTSTAFEPNFVANAPSPPQTCLFICVVPPPASGYITKLNAAGTGLAYSTFFSGTQTDRIDFAALAPGGIYVSGQASSTDFPGLEGVPSPCLPQTYGTRVSLDGSAVTAARATPGRVLAWNPANATFLTWTGTDLIAFDPSAAPGAIACIVDSADLRPVTSIAPGELLSIFGARFGSGPATGQANGSLLTSLAGVTVTFNGQAGPLLFVGPRQINVQAPYEIAGGTQAVVNLTSAQTNAADSLTLPVITRNPVAFLDTSYIPTGCLPDGRTYGGGPFPLAFNNDGSRNTCANPASVGSVVKIFLGGLGVTAPPPITGLINSGAVVPLNPPITFGAEVAAQVLSATALPGAVSGVWQVDVRMPLNTLGAVPVSLSVGSVPVRDTNLTIWTRR
jgi:uncharacterized protein (TIGR03437 family)